MTDYKSQDFSKKSLEQQVFNNCTFQQCNFTEAQWRGAHFCFCTFIGCNLSLVKLDACRLQEVVFIDCKIVGAEFYKCAKMLFSVEFKNSFLQLCNFSDLPMKKSKFILCKVRECHFTETNLAGADFTATDLAGTVFHKCDLSKADFSSAVNYAIDPQTNIIKKAKFSLPEAVGLLHGFDITLT